MDLVLSTEKYSIEVRDVIHGSIELWNWEREIIDTPIFQRLRGIKQLGFSELAYPCATHNRYTHSIGAMYVSGRAFLNIFKGNPFSNEENFWRYYYLVRAAVLLHDSGHGPLSHAIEFCMPKAKDLNMPAKILGTNQERQASHEDYTIKIITDSPLTQIIEKHYRHLGISANHIASLIDPNVGVDEDFFTDKGINYHNILSQLVSSEIDADRMDYLQRDAYYTGVSYGNYDFTWLLNNMQFHIVDDKAHLSLSNRAVYTFEDYLLSRYHMFLMVYFHYKSVVYEEMLKRYLDSPECEYRIPTDIEKYVEYDDTHLYAHLRGQKNEWAQRIVNRQPYKLAMELHGTKGGADDPIANPKMQDYELQLLSSNTPFIKRANTGTLSKYFMATGATERPEINSDTIFVQVNDRLTEIQYMPLESFTDVFRRHAEAKSIIRFYTPK